MIAVKRIRPTMIRVYNSGPVAGGHFLAKKSCSETIVYLHPSNTPPGAPL
jgi:hypothetical protein